MAQEQENKIEQMWADIDKKVETLSATLRKKVYPIVLQSVEESGAHVIGYAYKPDMTTQLRLIDKSEGNANGISLEAAGQAIEALIISAASDTRITDKNGEYYDVYWKGACYSLKQFMGLAVPELKKK